MVEIIAESSQLYYIQLQGILLKATGCRITLKLKVELLLFVEFVSCGWCQSKLCSSGKVQLGRLHLSVAP